MSFQDYHVVLVSQVLDDHLFSFLFPLENFTALKKVLSSWLMIPWSNWARFVFQQLLLNTKRHIVSIQAINCLLLCNFWLISCFQVCVARFPVDHEWYRGLITAIPSKLTVEVFYVDYGNSSQVTKSDIRLMKYD